VLPLLLDAKKGFPSVRGIALNALEQRPSVSDTVSNTKSKTGKQTPIPGTQSLFSVA